MKQITTQIGKSINICGKITRVEHNVPLWFFGREIVMKPYLGAYGVCEICGERFVYDENTNEYNCTVICVDNYMPAIYRIHRECYDKLEDVFE